MNIFLVEDERWALLELTALFQVYEPEHRIFPFDNGEDAKAAAFKTIPQLVVTDINMPGMDGLELIRQLHRLDAGIKGILVSVHDHFEYARQGFEIGVIDYLLKPVKKDVLYSRIDRAISRIENDEKNQEERINWIITQMLRAPRIPEELGAQSFYHHKYLMVLLSIGGECSLSCWEEAKLSNYDLKRKLAYAWLDDKDIYCVDMDAGRKVILVPVKDSSYKCSMESNLLTMFQQLSEQLQLHVSYDYKKEKASLHTCFEFLASQIEQHQKFGCSSFISPITKGSDVELGGLWNKVRIVEALFLQGDVRKGKEQIGRIVEELQMKEITHRQLHYFVMDVLYSLQYKRQSSKAFPPVSYYFEPAPINRKEWNSYQELADWLCGKAIEIYREPAPRDIKPKHLIPSLIHWIHTNYVQEICLQDFAADNHVSLGYLSKLFKTQIGSTFSDYLIHYRINKAKGLLEEGMERLSDVSKCVGYEDPKHFSYLFKKIIGESPHAYAKRYK